MKRAACLIFLTCSFFTVKAQNSLEVRQPSTSQFDKEKFKYGLQGGLGISLIISGGRIIGASKGGIFVEYKILQELSLQSGLAAYYNLYSLQGLADVQICDPFVSTIYLMIPITLRYYIDGIKNCFYIGMQLGHLIHGHAFPHDCGHKKKTSPISLTSGKLPTRKLGISIILGYDYEFDFGLIIGLTYIRDIQPVMRAKHVGFNWNLQPTVGYNIAKLL